MASKCLENKGTKNEHKQKLRWRDNDEKRKKQLTNPWQNIGSHSNDWKPNEQKFNIVRTQDGIPVMKKKQEQRNKLQIKTKQNNTEHRKKPWIETRMASH